MEIRTVVNKNGPKGWTLRTEQEGNRILFRDYHKAIINNLLTVQGSRWGSGDMYTKLKEQGIKISRTSVIFYLNFLVDDGLAVFDDVTSKGGHHKLYRIPASLDEVKKHIAIKVIKGLAEGLDLDLDWVLTNLI